MSNNLHPVILVGNTVESLQKTPANSIQLCVTSPPYWAQRDYGVPPTNWPEITFIPAVGLPPLTVKAMSCCLGLEPNHWDYIGHMVYVFREVKRVLRHDGLLFLNLGDSYACKATGNIGKKSTLNGLLDPNTQQQVGKKSFTQKASAKRPDKTGLPTGNMFLIPSKVAAALQADGWILRSEIIWSKRNPMPESTLVRPTKAHEPIFMLSKSMNYSYDAEAVKSAASSPPAIRRNQRDVWDLASEHFSKSNHTAKYPTEIPRRAILAGTSEYGSCITCGTPWQRKLVKINIKNSNGKLCQDTQTIGWKPGCKCTNNQPVPCKVLDPFAGSGTTGQAAFWLNRQPILCELGPKYVPMLRERVLTKPKWSI